MIANCASAPSGVARHSDDTSERRALKKAFISLTGVTPVLDITKHVTLNWNTTNSRYEVKTADSLPFANQQQPNTSRDAKQVLTYKYKEQNGQIRIKEKIKKPEFTLTPIKTGEKTGLQKIC